MIKIDFVTTDWPSLEKNMTWSNHPILITPTLRTRPDHKEGCQDQATTCRIEGTEFWNGRGIRRAWQSGSLAVTLNKCAMQIVSFRPVLSVLSFWRRWGIRSVNSSGQGLGQADSKENKGSLNKNWSWIQLLDFKTNRLQTVSDLLQRLRRLTSERVTSCVVLSWFCRVFLVASFAFGPRDVSFESAAGVAELEHQAIGKTREIDGIRIWHKVKSLKVSKFQRSLLQINVTGLKSFPLKQGLTSWLHVQGTG